MNLPFHRIFFQMIYYFLQQKSVAISLKINNKLTRHKNESKSNHNIMLYDFQTQYFFKEDKQSEISLSDYYT